MYSSEFEDIFQKFPIIRRHYSGCFSADNLPKFIKKNHFIICNTDISSGEGLHWYTCLRTSKSELELFDSLGFSAEKKQFIEQNFNLKGIKTLHFNTNS